MSEQDQAIRITAKLQQLVRTHEQLLKENAKLRTEVSELKQKQENSAGKIAELEQSVAVLRTLTGNMDEPDKKALEKQLNLYIREIDRCIAMLSE
jgi:cell division septum initiation protein DivIVA